MDIDPRAMGYLKGIAIAIDYIQEDGHDQHNFIVNFIITNLNINPVPE
jgi:hypothetical protein